MTRCTAIILTPWTADGDRTYVPRIILDYPEASYQDITNQPADAIPPVPNMFVSFIRCDASVLSDIGLNPAYEILASACLGKPLDERPGAVAMTALRDRLHNHHGFPSSATSQIANEMTRRAAVRKIVDACRRFPSPNASPASVH